MPDDREDNAYSRNPEDEKRYGEGYNDKDRRPTVQKFNAEEKKKREEVERQEQLSKKRGLSRVVADPVTGGRVRIQDSQGEPKRETEDMYVTVPRRNIVSTREASRLERRDFNSEGIHESQLQDNHDADHNNLPFASFLKRHKSKSSTSSRATTGQRISQSKSDSKSDERKNNSRTNAHDEDGWVDLPMRGERTNVLVRGTIYFCSDWTDLAVLYLARSRFRSAPRKCDALVHQISYSSIPGRVF